MRVAIALVAVLVLAGCAAGKTTVSTVTVTTPGSPKTAAPGAQNTGYFGQIVSVTDAPDSSRLLLVLRPQFYLVGVPANTAFAAQQGKQCAPLSCPGVEDDRLVVSAGSQQLTFVLPAKTTGTVLTLSGSKTQTTTVSAAQLAALAAGAKTPKLVEPLSSGVWLAVDTDRITSFAQQFEP
jgi:hypothetical protein